MPFIFSSTKKSNTVSTVKKSLRKLKQNETQKAEVMKDANRENYQYEQQTQELGMSSLLKDHNNGDRFLYAAITSKNSEDRGGMLRRLLQHQQKIQKTVIPVGNLPRLDLFDEVETFQLQDIISKKSGTFIHISEIMVIYGSLISTEDVFSKVKISIIDDRKPKDKVATSFIANTNLCSRAILSLPYCIPRNEINLVSLTISRESAFLEPGVQWGAAQVMIQLKELDFPSQYSTNPTCAINTIPEGMLEEHQYDPRHVDISIMNNNKKGLKELYLNGDLVDETSPISNKTENAKYAKSSLKDSKGKKPETYRTKDWEFINDKRVTVVADDNSVSVSEGDDESENSTFAQMKLEALKENRLHNLVSGPSSPPLRSAMKRTVKIEDPVVPIVHSI